MCLFCQLTARWIPMRWWWDNCNDRCLARSDRSSCFFILSDQDQSQINNLDAFRILEYFTSNLSPLCHYCITDIFKWWYVCPLCTSTTGHSLLFLRRAVHWCFMQDSLTLQREKKVIKILLAFNFHYKMFWHKWQGKARLYKIPNSKFNRNVNRGTCLMSVQYDNSKNS